MLRNLARQLTPVALRRWVSRFRNNRSSILSNRRDLGQLQAFERILNRHGCSFKDVSSVLDFGCGYGRLTKHVADLASNAMVVGCDIDKFDIKQCRTYSPNARFVATEPEARLPFDDNCFHLIYSYSVFTNFAATDIGPWLRELGRVVQPGGLMLHTLHSYECLKRLQVFSEARLEKYQLGMTVPEFVRLAKDYHAVRLGPREYLTVFRKEHVMKEWPRMSNLSLLEYAEGAIESNPEGCQDVVLLGK